MFKTKQMLLLKPIQRYTFVSVIAIYKCNNLKHKCNQSTHLLLHTIVNSSIFRKFVSSNLMLLISIYLGIRLLLLELCFYISNCLQRISALIYNLHLQIRGQYLYDWFFGSYIFINSTIYKYLYSVIILVM